MAKESAQPKDPRTGAQPQCTYVTVAEGEPNSFQMLRHSQIIQQCSSSTDEGCDTDHGEMEDVIQPSVPPSIQRLNSYASSSSSSGVVTNFHTKSLSQNLSCESSRSNFSTFESLDLNLSDCSDLAASLPSCASSIATTINENSKDHGKLFRNCLMFNFSFVSLFFVILLHILYYFHLIFRAYVNRTSVIPDYSLFICIIFFFWIELKCIYSHDTI